MLGLPHFPPPRYQHLYEEIHRVKPRSILEVGTNDGINAAMMVNLARQHQPQVEYYGFDLFEELDTGEKKREFSIGTKAKAAVEAYLQRHGVSNVKLFGGDTRVAIPAALTSLPPMDLIFIDGGHSYETVLSDWSNVQALARQGTSVLFDDYPNFGIGPVVDAIDRSQWDVTVFPTVDRFSIRDPSFAEGKGKEFLEIQIARVRRKA